MEKETNFVCGVNSVLEKLRARADDVEEILIARGSEKPALSLIATEAGRLGLRVAYVDPNQLSRLAGETKHQGVLAKVAPYGYLSFAALTQRLSSSAADHERVLILDGLTDPRNFGALLRTAEAVGIRAVVIPKDRSVDVTPTVARASSGALHHLNIYKVANLRRVVSAVKEFGFWTVGLNLRSAESIYERAYPDKLAIILGSEGKGIRPLILRECDFQVSIPMLGKVASLNVAVAGAVFLYEILRQKRGLNKIGDRFQRRNP